MSLLRSCSICIVASLAMLGCSSQHKDITIETEANPWADFAGYQTYAWGAAAAAVRDPEREWTPPDLNLGAEIKFLTDRELRARGMTKVVESPDVLAMYAVGVDMMALNVVIEEEAERWEKVPQGGVLIILADAATRQVVWAGSAVADLMEEPTVESTKERLDYAITTMFKRMPR
jgi:hypothetical protein